MNPELRPQTAEMTTPIPSVTDLLTQEDQLVLKAKSLVNGSPIADIRFGTGQGDSRDGNHLEVIKDSYHCQVSFVEGGKVSLYLSQSSFPDNFFGISARSTLSVANNEGKTTTYCLNEQGEKAKSIINGHGVETFEMNLKDMQEMSEALNRLDKIIDTLKPQ